MGFFNRFRLALSVFRKDLEPVSLTDPKRFKNIFKEWLQMSGGDDNTGYIAACVDVWGRAFADVIFRVYDKEEDNEEVINHPALRLFQRPNWFQTAWEIKYRIAQDFAFWGNSYFLKLKDSLGVPRAFIQLHPDRIFSLPYDLERIDAYEYQTAQGSLRLEISDIIHLRYPDPDNYIKGKAIISKIADLKEVEQLQMAYRKKFYESGGFLGATFTTEQKMTDTNFDRALKQLQDKYGGSDNAFQVALFEQGLKPIPTAYSLRDMQMKDDRMLNRDEILSAFSINKILLGQSEQIQRGNAETVFWIFASTVIDPLMRYISEALTNQLLITDFSTDIDTPYYFAADPMAQKDRELDLKLYDNGSKNKWLKPSEIRALEGYEKDERLDEIFLTTKQTNGQLITAS